MGQLIDYNRQIKNLPTIPTVPTFNFLSAEDFDWSRTNGTNASGNLSSPGGNQVTLTTSPEGLAIGQYVRISGGTGTAETCPITGVLVSGADTIVTITTANAHSGAWVIESGSQGIKEAFETLGNKGHVILGSGTYEIYGPLLLGTRCNLWGQGWDATILNFSTTTSGICTGIADNLGIGTGGSGSINYLAIVGPGNISNVVGAMQGYDPTGTYTQITSGWAGSYFTWNKVRITNCKIAHYHGHGICVDYYGCAFGAGCTTGYTIAAGGEAQPVRFYSGIISTSNSTDTMILNNPFADICFDGTQISGTIGGTGVRFKSNNAHFEPNDTGVIFNVTSGSCVVRIIGGTLSLHPGTTITNGLRFAAASTAYVAIIGTEIQCDAGTTVTNLVHFENVIGGHLFIDDIHIVDGTFTNIWTMTSSPDVIVRVNTAFITNNTQTLTPSAGVLTFNPRYNFPDMDAIAILGGATTITSVAGLRIGARFLVYSVSGTINWTAGATIGNTFVMTEGIRYIASFDGTKLWLH